VEVGGYICREDYLGVSPDDVGGRADISTDFGECPIVSAAI
jgi:hypothetical protein